MLLVNCVFTEIRQRLYPHIHGDRHGGVWGGVGGGGGGGAQKKQKKENAINCVGDRGTIAFRLYKGTLHKARTCVKKVSVSAFCAQQFQVGVPHSTPIQNAVLCVSKY